mmetsp:Transcript_19374/g.34587  ORF Transcript_19374/g.34587 Transcript_19374/m.34587 type:complete len:337 (+) Transcript_19374:179-1189(+)|eukprot:CAMPEP_0197526098 /NCGR_PEP_ID=MMETSP1318-20131121/16363_1 /TAXON_ID=552666 /ORGANISM="Partenskyella glossopodia, Strain RCC365" /LENGTH=336 /DNA_ID=CAMNT_0043080101 /DNA_START=171 /DNA_END=1181 /DNA_ORIENTATION=-
MATLVDVNRHVEALASENDALKQQLSGSKDLLQALAGQIQEVMEVNHAVAAKLEQTSEVRKYLDTASDEFKETVDDCGELIQQIVGKGKAGDAEAAGILEAELQKLQSKNEELQRECGEHVKEHARQRSEIAKQDRWVKQLSNVVANLRTKLDEKGKKLQTLIESQSQTTQKLQESERIVEELSKVNRALFAKLKQVTGGGGCGGASATASGGSLGMIPGSDSDVPKPKEDEIVTCTEGKEKESCAEAVAHRKDVESSKEVERLRIEIQALREKLDKVDQKRKATNQRAHALAQEKQSLASRVQQQRGTIQGLRRRLATSKQNRPASSSPRWSNNY